MQSGKIFLIIFVVLSTVIGLAIIQDYSLDNDESVSADDFSSEEKILTIDLTDGIGSSDKG